jgi:hypothetical protein
MVGLAIGGLFGGGGVDEQGVPGETRVPLAALGVEDPEARRPARPAIAVVGDERLGDLTDDVATQADPVPAGELQADAGRLVDRGRQPATETRGIEHEQERLRPARQGGEAMEPVGDLRWGIAAGEPAAGQIQDEQVHRATGEQAAGDRQALVEAGRRDHHEPLEADTAGDRLDRVEAA